GAQLSAQQPHLEGKRLLIVDDNAVNRRVLTLQAQSWGMLPRDTGLPAEALEWIRRGDPFDAAVLDMNMPEMDGVMLATEIRRLRPATALPLVMCTSLRPRESTPEADAVSWAAFLTKPVKQSQMFEVLARLFRDAPEAPTSVEPQPPPGEMMAQRHPLRILLAEDNTVNQRVALRLLGQLGYRADIAANGIEALQAVERQEYDLILMDVQMPEMDGLEASRRLCARWPRHERPRIVAMTANAMQGDRESCLSAGMDDYVSKPIRLAELAAAQRRCESRLCTPDAAGSRPSAQPEGQAEREAAAEDARSSGFERRGPGAEESEEPVLDSAALSSLRDLMGAEALPEFIESLIADGRSLLADI